MQKIILTGLAWATLLLSSFANAVVKPVVVQQEFKRWTTELNTILQDQPKSSTVRSDLHAWFTDQGRSLSKVKEPILSASLPSKMWGSAAYVTDSANNSFGTLSGSDYGALLDFSNRILDYCFKAYQPRQSVCTDEHFWELKAKNTLYLAQLGESDSIALLNTLPVMLKTSFNPLSGGYASNDLRDIASDRCMGWYRLMANFLMPNYNNVPSQLTQPVYVEAYLAQTAETLRICEQAQANPSVYTRQIADLGLTVMDVAKPVSDKAIQIARPVAERAYQILLDDKDDAGTTNNRIDHQLKLFLLAHTLGKQVQAKAWADAIPKTLVEINERTGDDFNCRFFVSETKRTPSAWSDAVFAFPEAYRAMQTACPELES